MCAGPMSKNFVDAFISYHQKKKISFNAYSSRRQIETKNLNHGYVNNWSTEKFSSYVQKKIIILFYVERSWWTIPRIKC